MKIMKIHRTKKASNAITNSQQQLAIQLKLVWMYGGRVKGHINLSSKPHTSNVGVKPHTLQSECDIPPCFAAPAPMLCTGSDTNLYEPRKKHISKAS